MLASAKPAAAIAVAAPAPRRKSVYLIALRGISRDPFAISSCIVLIVVALAAVLGPSMTPYDPLEQTLTARLRPPVWQDRALPDHPFGTDQLGRDLLSRMIFGARVSAVVGMAVIVFGGALGTALGLSAGFFRGKFETIVVGIVDVVLSFPSLLLALTIVSVLGPNLWTVVLALSMRGWVVYARVTRGQALSLSQSQFVEAARTIGASSPRIVARHLLPNLLPSVLTIAVLELARVVLAESSLSFLGLGIQPPAISWGLMLSEGRNYMLTANWLVTLPGLAIALTVLSVNILASHVRRVLDPFQRGRVETESR